MASPLNTQTYGLMLHRKDVSAERKMSVLIPALKSSQSLCSYCCTSFCKSCCVNMTVSCAPGLRHDCACVLGLTLHAPNTMARLEKCGHNIMITIDNKWSRVVDICQIVPSRHVFSGDCCDDTPDIYFLQ